MSVTYTAPPNDYQVKIANGYIYTDSYRNWIFDASALTNGNGYTIILPNSIYYRPTAIFLSDPDNTTVLVSGDTRDTILNGSPNWISLTPASVIVLDYSPTAIQIGNNGSDDFHATITQ
jgi:hypothetical protein